MEKNNMRIILAGTPEFSRPVFQEIIDNFDVVAIICQPDKRSGRGMKLKFSPVKELAIKNNVLLLQPEKIIQISDKIEDLNPDLLITCAYGQIIPEKILNIPSYNSLNIHASLLPRHRGAAPIQYSILANDKYTGITLMKMVKKMDAGDMIFQQKILINDKTTKELFEELSLIAKNSIVKWLSKFFNNEYTTIVQQEDMVTFAPKITKEDAHITHEDSIQKALLKIRAFSDFTGVTIKYKDIKLKIFGISLNPHKNTLAFKLSDGDIYIKQVKAPGKRKMFWFEYINGEING